VSKVVKKFVECQFCSSQLTPSDIIKSQNVPQSTLFALLLKCPRCSKLTKSVTQYEDWEEAKHYSSRRRNEQRKVLEEAHTELEDVVDITYLKAVWAHSAPLREEVMNKCGCEECRKRLYAEEG